MASHIPTIEIKVAQTLLANLITATFNSEYETLLKVASDSIKDSEAAKEILSESFTSVLEAAYKIFQPNEVKNLLIHEINESCQVHIKEIQDKKEYELVQAQKIEVDNLYKEEIRKAAFDAFDKLPEERQKIIDLRQTPGATAKKVAAKYQMDTNKVEDYYNYSVKLLRKLFFSNLR